MSFMRRYTIKTKKKTDNQIVAEWLIKYRWKNTISDPTKQRMPAFVDDAVMSAIYVVAGTSNGQVNVSPKLVTRCLTLPEISVDTVITMELGYDMSLRHAQRVAQTVRFALEGILHRVQEYEASLTDLEIENIKMEKDFITAYYTGFKSPLYSEPLAPIPEHINELKVQGLYLEYGEAVREFRQANK